jgi:hypothetical protein
LELATTGRSSSLMVAKWRRIKEGKRCVAVML